MKILADSAIPWLDKLFLQHAEIDRYTGREIEQTQLQFVDILLTRSTLNVTGDLLKDTSVKFVGSATVGCDHIDQKALRELGVAFVHAPGCNANAVSEYVVAALAWHEKKAIISFENSLMAAVIGCGQIGSKVKEKLEILGFEVVVNDPPLEQSEANGWKYVDLQQAMQADVICVHTPLTKTGDFPTFHLIGKNELASANPNAILINAGRGEVVDNSALLDTLAEKSNLNVVLDVWENEPEICQKLLTKVNLGTPHIAGHSWRGKVMGSVMIYQSVSEFFGWQPHLIDESDFKAPLSTPQLTTDFSLHDVIANCYDIESDTSVLRSVIDETSKLNTGKAFDLFRKNYYQRPEFSDLSCQVTNQTFQAMLRDLGFDVTGA